MTRAERRKNDFHKALRKQKLDENLSGNISNYRLYDNLHQYSKNKIHCSCGLCSCKTKNKGHRRRVPHNYYPSYNPCTRDRRRIDAMNFDENDTLFTKM